MMQWLRGETQVDEKKQESAPPEFNCEANVTISRGFKLPLCKLTVSGTIDSSTTDTTTKIIQRAIVFVIDRSGSMSGSRINNVKQALQPFIEEICSDQNTIIKIVLFDNNTETLDIPRNANSAKSLIEKRVNAQGGTDFHHASQGLVTEAGKILNQYPSYQVRNFFFTLFYTKYILVEFIQNLLNNILYILFI